MNQSAGIKIIFRECRRNDEGKHEEAPKVDVKTPLRRLMPQIEQMVIENSLDWHLSRIGLQA